MAVKAKKISSHEMFLANIPNFLSISRIILAFVVIYLIFVQASVVKIVSVFAIAALTDFFDGRLARRFKWQSEFGRKADMIADRFLWVGTALAFIIDFGIRGYLNWTPGIQLLFMMSREIISLPFAIIAFFSGNALPNARYIAKVTTFIQGFALPSLILSIEYPAWIYASLPLSLIAGITGFVSAMYYINDVRK